MSVALDLAEIVVPGFFLAVPGMAAIIYGVLLTVFSRGNRGGCVTGDEWPAVSTSDEEIPPGTRERVVGVEACTS